MNQGFLNPEEILDQLDLKADMTAAEFGCGSGGFTVYLAKRLSEGLVWAIDIQEGVLSALKSRQLMEGIHNIKIVRGNLERANGSTIPASSLDLVVIPNVLFEAEDKIAIMKEADRVLKNRGILVVIDWLSEAAHGPEHNVSPKEVKEMAEDLELNFKKEISAGKYHYGLVFEK
jgi:ubiquinone/menaquinone biosynthesis C-methylase UbiE